MSMSILGPGPSSKKNSSLAMGRILLGMDIAEDKGGNLPLVMTPPTVPRSRKSAKAGKDNGGNRNVWGKCCHYSIPCLVPDTTILFCLYNHSQQLEGRANGTGTYPKDPIQKEGNYYKKGGEKERKVGQRPPPTTNQRHQKKLPESHREPIFSGKLGPRRTPWLPLSIH